MKMQMGSCYLNKCESNSTNEQAMTVRGKEVDTQKAVTMTRDTSPCVLISVHEGLDSGGLVGFLGFMVWFVIVKFFWFAFFKMHMNQ